MISDGCAARLKVRGHSTPSLHNRITLAAIDPFTLSGEQRGAHARVWWGCEEASCLGGHELRTHHIASALGATIASCARNCTTDRQGSFRVDA